MIETLIGIVGVLLAALLGLAALLLPGAVPALYLARTRAKEERRGPWPLIASILIGHMAILLTGLVMVAVGIFSAQLMAIAMLLLAAPGAVVLAAWVRAAVREQPVRVAALIAVAALSIPWALASLVPGGVRSNTFQWYYWDLGRELSVAGGVPSTVPEFGLSVRFLPDYIGFNFLSEAYRGLSGPIPEIVQIVSWRVPVVIVGLLVFYCVFRLWLSRPASIVGLLAIATTTFFISKFNVYKPEAVGIILGAASTWMLVTGVRRGRPLDVLIAGVGIGIAMSVHAIAATAFGVLMVAAGLVEWIGAEDRRADRFRWLVSGALTALVVTVAVGLAVQGRAIVLGDAFRPEVTEGSDLTWLYLQYTGGQFGLVGDPPSIRAEISEHVLQPWAGVRMNQPRYRLAVIALGIGLLVALLSHPRVRRGMLTGGLFAAGLGLVMAAFAIGFDTYVPRYTGLSRFGQYTPILWAAAIAFVADGLILTLRRFRGGPSRIGATWAAGANRRLGLILPAILLVPAVLYVHTQYGYGRTIEAPGMRALEYLGEHASPHETVITNAITAGLVQFVSDAEVPFESRQPLIEDPDLLATAIERLELLHRYLDDPDDEGAADEIRAYGARWLLIVDRAPILGANRTYGGTTERFAGDPSLALAWSEPGIAIYETVDGGRPAVRSGARLDQAGQIATTTAVAFVLLVVLAIAAGVHGGRGGLRPREMPLPDERSAERLATLARRSERRP